MPFSKGRLTSISRSSASVDYAYDRFGRVTQDGALTYSYNLNSNRTSIGYPGGVSTTTSYDFADRESTLTLDDGTSTQPIVTGGLGISGSVPLSVGWMRCNVTRR